MITGFNTDISFNGRVYHVQTEDRGLGNPIVESLVYSGGEIITSRKSSYADLVHAGCCVESDVLRRMESQHKELIREIRNGRFETKELKPFGHSIITNRSLDEVVLAFLEEHVTLEPIKLNLRRPKILVQGARPTLELEVLEEATERPIRGANVVVRLVATGTRPQQLLAAPTDKQGRVLAEIAIPDLPGSNAAIVCQADASGRTAELKQLIKKPVPGSSAETA